jgi:ABC-type glycerol-3-phosphate transport system permease component
VKRPRTFLDGLIILFLSVCAATVLYPVSWVLYTSIKTNREFVTHPWGLPAGFSFDNYITAWTSVRFATYAGNSILITSAAVILTVFLAVLCAYPLARFRFRLRGSVFLYMIAGLFIPVTIILVPQYLLVNNLGLIDSRFGLTLIYTAVNLPYSILILTGFLRGIPGQLEEAGQIDGLNAYGRFFRIILPLSRNGMLTVAIFNFIYIWNDYIFALTFLSSTRKRTLPVGLIGLMESFRLRADWVTLFAGLAMVMVPSIVIYVVFHSRLEDNITAGSFK